MSKKNAVNRPGIPLIIATRTASLVPLIELWVADHKGVPFSKLLQRGLKRELAAYAGKRHAHLLADD